LPSAQAHPVAVLIVEIEGEGFNASVSAGCQTSCARSITFLPFSDTLLVALLIVLLIVCCWQTRFSTEGVVV